MRQGQDSSFFSISHPSSSQPCFQELRSSHIRLQLWYTYTMKRTASQALNEPQPTLLVETAIKLDLYMALNPVQFQALLDKKAILPDPYSQRFGLRSDPFKPTERAHYFMNWPPDQTSSRQIPPSRFKKFMICRITFTPVGFLNLTDTGVLEHGDGWTFDLGLTFDFDFWFASNF